MKEQGTMLAKANLVEVFGPVGSVQPDLINEMVMVVVKPGYEQQARDSFRRHGVGTWWPNYQREVTSKDRETGKRMPRSILTGVMPGILLCRTRLDERFWMAMDLAPGAINVARRTNNDPLILRDLDIVLIHKIEAELNRPAPAKSEHSFKAGDRVRFADDLMRRFPAGVVTKCLRNGHIEVEVNVLSRLTPFTVWGHQLEAA